MPKLWNVLASIGIGNVLEREGGIAHWLRLLVSSGKRATYYCSFRSNPIQSYVAVVIPTEVRVNSELQMYIDLSY